SLVDLPSPQLQLRVMTIDLDVLAFARLQRLQVGDGQVLTRPDIRLLHLALRLNSLQAELLLGFKGLYLLHAPAFNSGERCGEAALSASDADDLTRASLQVVSFKPCSRSRQLALVVPLRLRLLRLSRDRGGERCAVQFDSRADNRAHPSRYGG